MIQTVTNHSRAQEGTGASRSGRTGAAAPDFRALFRGKTSGAPTPQAASPAVEKTPAKAALQTAAQAPAAKALLQTAVQAPPAKSQPADPARARTEAAAQDNGLPVAFTQSSIETTMNQWLAGVLQRQNEQRTQIYNNALEGWKNVNARNRELGLPEIPPPAAPELAQVAPMPPGWWFTITS